MKIAFIGNSHTTQLYSNIENVSDLSIKYNGGVLSLYKIGASIKGLVNPNSRLGLKTMIKTFSEINSDYTLVYFLGQVDIEFGYYYKCIKDNIKYDVTEYIVDLINRYESYLLEQHKDIYILSINPCVLRNEERLFDICFREINGNMGYYSEENDSIKFENCKDFIDCYSIRYTHNKLFNKHLLDMCKRNNFTYIDFWHLVEENDTVRDEYNPKNIDHHLLNPNDNIFNFICSQVSLKD